MDTENNEPLAGIEPSGKSKRRAIKSNSESSGDRRTGSVGERPELAGTRDSGGKRDGTESDNSITGE